MYKLLKSCTLFAVLSIFVVYAVKGSEGKTPEISINDVPASAWIELAKKKIYFGHRSVEHNIIDGIKDLIEEHSQIKLNMVEITSKVDFENGFFAHSWIRPNDPPRSIASAYLDMAENKMGKNFDIVLLKFNTYGNKNLKEVINEYKKGISIIKNKYPESTFLHMTFPVVKVKTTWKRRIKKMLGKDDAWEYNVNIKANEFNELLRKEYVGREPIFDLAKLQSTYPDGSRATFTKDEKKYFQMVEAYTNDGTHLNEKGRKIIAEQFLIFLANQVK